MERYYAREEGWATAEKQGGRYLIFIAGKHPSQCCSMTDVEAAMVGAVRAAAPGEGHGDAAEQERSKGEAEGAP
jgi:hypothetical protein